MPTEAFYKDMSHLWALVDIWVYLGVSFLLGYLLGRRNIKKGRKGK
jgi:hypothetical protein